MQPARYPPLQAHRAGRSTCQIVDWADPAVNRPRTPSWKVSRKSISRPEVGPRRCQRRCPSTQLGKEPQQAKAGLNSRANLYRQVALLNGDPPMDTRSNAEVVRAPRGPEMTCKAWQTEAALRMLMNNLDPEVAERPEELVVYGGIGKAARNWEAFHRIVESLRALEDDETLLVQSGTPVGVFRTHADAPRVLIASSYLVAKWATWEHFDELDRKGLMMFGQLTAGSWIYIGSQGIVQGTYETFVEAGRRHYGGDLRGRWILTAGLGGMGGAQPLAATFAGACSLNVECQQSRIDFRLRTKYLDKQAKDLDEALAMIKEH